MVKNPDKENKLNRMIDRMKGSLTIIQTNKQKKRTGRPKGSLTIIPRARVSSELIAHEAKNGLLTQGP